MRPAIQCLVLLTLLFPASSIAHSLRMPEDTSGVSIPPLSHGQMAVIADHRSKIETLASWVAMSDPDIRRLLAFSREQYTRCFWGIMPGSIDDEASPFNECSHAYLAADREMLVRLRNLPLWQDKAVALFDAVERDMIERGSSVVLCAFSATPFNTASLVNPDWHDFATHRPTLLSLAGGLGVLLLAIGAPIRTAVRQKRVLHGRG